MKTGVFKKFNLITSEQFLKNTNEDEVFSLFCEVYNRIKDDEIVLLDKDILKAIKKTLKDVRK